MSCGELNIIKSLKDENFEDFVKFINLERLDQNSYNEISREILDDIFYNNKPFWNKIKKYISEKYYNVYEDLSPFRFFTNLNLEEIKEFLELRHLNENDAEILGEKYSIDILEYIIKNGTFSIDKKEFITIVFISMPNVTEKDVQILFKLYGSNDMFKGENAENFVRLFNTFSIPVMKYLIENDHVDINYNNGWYINDERDEIDDKVLEFLLEYIDPKYIPNQLWFDAARNVRESNLIFSLMSKHPIPEQMFWYFEREIFDETFVGTEKEMNKILEHCAENVRNEVKDITGKNTRFLKEYISKIAGNYTFEKDFLESIFEENPDSYTAKKIELVFNTPTFNFAIHFELLERLAKDERFSKYYEKFCGCV